VKADMGALDNGVVFDDEFQQHSMSL
jgi:hypothetical protein